MSKDYTKELNEMYRLMNYGMNESKKTTANQGIVEYSQLGADGKTYGILKEGTKYFVKVAPKKNTAILAEDYDYVNNGRRSPIGYDSYTKASNALNLQLISVNESAGSKKPVKSQFNLNESAEWQNSQTVESRKELNRFYQLVSNVDKLLNENVHYINESDNTYSEKPNTKDGGGHKGNCGKQQKLGINDKNWTKDNSKVNADAEYSKYGVKGNSPSGKYDAASGINQIDQTQGNPYQEKPKTAKEQGKSIFEGKRKFKLSEEQEKQITAWKRGFVHSDEEGLLDRSHGTSIGDRAPYTNSVNEQFDTNEWDDGLPGNPGIGEPKKYKKPFDNQGGVRQPVSEGYIFEVEMNEMDDLSDDGADAFDDSFYNKLDSGDFSGEDGLGDGSYEDLKSGLSDTDLRRRGNYGINDDDMLSDIPNDEDPIDGFDDTDAEGFTRPGEEFSDHPNGFGRGFDDHDMGSELDSDNNIDDFEDEDDFESESGPIFEVTLNDFGKHPAYRKSPMTLPKNADGSEWGEDWNDESTKGEQPYGRQIGHSGDPFTDKVNAITNAVVTALSDKKKV